METDSGGGFLSSGKLPSDYKIIWKKGFIRKWTEVVRELVAVSALFLLRTEGLFVFGEKYRYCLGFDMMICVWHACSCV